MKNKELQDLLKTLPNDANVKLCYGEEVYDFNSARLINNNTIVLQNEYGFLSRYF
jgi:hypothetical protein